MAKTTLNRGKSSGAGREGGFKLTPQISYGPAYVRINFKVREVKLEKLAEIYGISNRQT